MRPELVGLALAFLSAVLTIVAGAVALVRRDRLRRTTTITVARESLFRAGDRIEFGGRRARIISVTGSTITFR